VPAVGGVGRDFQPGQQFGQRFCRDRILADDDHGVTRQQHDRLEIGQEIVAELVDGAVRDMGAEMTEADGVAVGRRPHGAANADRAARSRDVLDHDRFTERHLHALGENSRHGVRRASRRERHDNGDGMRREIIGARGAACDQQRRK
jgi:hypothetical protein